MKVLFRYRLLFILILVLISACLTSIYKYYAYKHVIIEFKEMRPLHGHPPVYYKGIKIGRVEKTSHNDTFTRSLVKINLHPKDIKLPQNTGALLKKDKKRELEYDYIELVYPKNPSRVWLQNNDKIKGKTTVDVKTYLANQDPDTLEDINTSISKTIEDLDTTINALGDLFVILEETVQENRTNLKTTSTNLASTSKNINKATAKIEQALKQDELDNTLSNIAVTTQNLENLTGNLEEIIQDTGTTMPTIENIIKNSNLLFENLNSITCAVKRALEKPFGGFRILFGRSINEKY